MKQVFSNETAVEISRFAPTAVTSSIDVANIPGSLQRISVTLDLVHTYTSDLRISLSAPSGASVLLVGNAGGNGDNFFDTTFDDGAGIVISEGIAPFQGTFRPQQPLAPLLDSNPNGTWTLQIQDEAFMDGGVLNRWSLDLVVEPDQPDALPASQFSIQLRFLGGLTATQRAVFEVAAARWSEIIIGDLPSAVVNGETIDDILIEARGLSIDGPNGVLGQAGPTRLRSGSMLPITGVMEFDMGDLARLEMEGGLLDVIIHEMGHVFGIGTIWQIKNLLVGAGSANPTYVGQNGMREFAALVGAQGMTPVPVANTGGQGTRDGHWREAVFGNELMTGFLNLGQNPLSRLTVGCLEDLGYAVNYTAADPYELPSALALAVMGVNTVGNYGRRQCRMCDAGILGTHMLSQVDAH
ncbi:MULTISPECIES: proprotein convertase P-domain-containing protein [Cyanophyceae]|uniref:Proprotein convertase P-domain-containing protein n=1 Tax=Leptolyngbya subtilissima DQ-A4 TaxID=2933933 RepID=A0ABV0K163_9CYAN|nr:proprotein convertase P-domain-containing protein [Nodosilinea sp. FACHB-141]MBD2111282.1 proprotein convertase P-domain-containing protein [Nodosilinea sp. FACHB-141]